MKYWWKCDEMVCPTIHSVVANLRYIGPPDDQYYNPFHTQLDSVCSLPSTLACSIYTWYILLHTVHVLLAYSGILLLHTIIIPNNTPPPTQYTILFCNSTYVYCFIIQYITQYTPAHYHHTHSSFLTHTQSGNTTYLVVTSLTPPMRRLSTTYLSLYEEDSIDPSIEGTLEGIKHCLTVSNTCLWESPGITSDAPPEL